jgi:hypothetical protein
MGRGCKPPAPPKKGPRGKTNFKEAAEALKPEIDEWTGLPIVKKAPQASGGGGMGGGGMSMADQLAA